MEQALFYIFSIGMLFFGFLTITSRNPVHSGIALIPVFFFMAGLFVLLHAFFLAAVQVLVYAGAIMVLFLFVIMLLNLSEEDRHRLPWFGIVAGTLVLVGLVVEFWIILRRARLDDAVALVETEGLTANMGKLLFSRYILPFEITSLLLLGAMIGVILLSRKEDRP